jgi:multidrug resistance efflux pump
MARISWRFRLLLLLALLAAGLAACLLVPPVRSTVAAWLGFRSQGQDTAGGEQSIVVATGEVDVEGGILPLSPSQSGVVEQVPVKGGEAVAKGALLVSVDPRQSADQVAQTEARRRSAAIRLEQARAKAAEHDLRVRLAQEAVKEAQARVEAQQVRVRQLSELAERNLVAPSDLESAAATLQALRAALGAEQLRKEQVEREKPEQGVQLAQADLDAAAAALDSARVQQEGTMLKAPTDGVVLRVLIQPGRLLRTADTAIWFRPDRPWVVRCDIDQQFINRVAAKMPCDVCEDRGEAILARGTVERIGIWVAARRPALDEATTRRDARTVECVVALSRPPTNLRVGQRVRVIIHTGP